eukprot:jgi/Picsp_1/356/NSC_00355-R1_thioredoxin h
MLSLSARQVCRREQGLLKRVGTIVTDRQYDAVRGFSTGDDKVMEIKSVEKWKEVLDESMRNKGGVLCQFTAVWCPPCRMIAPYVQQLAHNFPGTTFVKVDIDNGAMTELVSDHAITSVPTFVGFSKEGKVVGSFTGADKQALDSLVATLSE